MLDTNNTQYLTCSTHGKQPMCFVCRHLVKGSAQGFYSADDPENPRPDAWCDQCHQVYLNEGGEWTEQAVAHADIALVCGQCYDKIRNLYRIVKE